MKALVVSVEPLRQNAFVAPFDYLRGQQDRRTCDAFTLAKLPSSAARKSPRLNWRCRLVDFSAGSNGSARAATDGFASIRRNSAKEDSSAPKFTGTGTLNFSNRRPRPKPEG